MTRYGGLGRTRPKKLTPKASIPIVREEDIDALDEDIQNHQQIETGVEKAEESVSHHFPPPHPSSLSSHNFSLIPKNHVTSSPNRHEIFTTLTIHAFHRNSIYKLP